MKDKIHAASGPRTSSLNLSVARLHSRLSRRLTRGISTRSAARFDSSLSLFNSLWSPVRLDLLKAPLTRYRE